jgi:hypothetical protein
VKSLSLILAALLSFATSASAQTTHKVTLTWSDALNPPGTTYTVMRATGLCTGTPAFSTLASGLTTLTYVDTTVTPGNYCYQVEASSGGILSAPSNTALAPVPSFAPTALLVAVQ